jgi:serine/threonine protein kinase
VKLLHAQLPEEQTGQFLHEAQLLARLCHPHIVRILDFAVQEGTPFLVMEYAPGGTLRSLHPKGTRIPLETVVRYVSHVAAALQYAHNQQLIHRDVKPENMLLGSRAEVLLGDFGLARLSPHTLSARTEAMEQPLAGTSPYLAPEQLHGKPRPASDQYALGVVVYEWLCGTPPFHGSPFEIAMQHLSLPAPPLREHAPELSPAIEEVVLRALAKEPGQRFASVQDFATALERACLAAVTSISPDSSIGAAEVHLHSPVPALHIRLLGVFQLFSGETPVTSVDGPRLQSLLAYLTLHHSAPQARAHLAYSLWPDSTDEQALTNLRNAIHKLRRTLPDVDAFLHVTRLGLQWQATRPGVSWSLDVQEFERALARAEEAERAGDLKAERQAFTRAVEVYQGDLLPASYDEWIIPERDRLRQAFLRALERLIGLLEGEREYAVAIGLTQRLLRLDPLQEGTYRQLMRLYAASGDRASALRIYHTCLSTLERELGAEPSRATREAYQQLVQKETPAHVPETQEAQPRPVQPTYLTLLGAAPLVGRQQEWGQLQASWRNAALGQPHMVVLMGEAGIGKTRLAEELLTWVAQQGISTATARCYAAQGGLAFAPVANWLSSEAIRPTLTLLGEVWLSEVARLLPDLLVERPGLRRPDALTESWQRKHVLESLARALLGTHQPLLLLLDDIQWCDQETLEWMHFLLRFEPRAPLLVLSTMRTEEMDLDHPASSLLMNLRRDRLLTELALEPLNVDETASLALNIAGQNLDEQVLAQIYRETEGNPLFVVESMRAGTIGPSNEIASSIITPAHYDTSMPPTVQAVIASRLAQLSIPSRELAGLAAVIGRAFTYEVLVQASGYDEYMLVQGLDELWQRRIVREQGGETYDFSHDKLREGAYTALSNARRRLLHRRVAEALEKIYASDLGAVSGQIAAHYEGASLPQLAASYYLQAGEVALQIHANVDALTAFQRALALLAAFPAEVRYQERWQERATRLHEAVGDIFELMGQYNQARDAYRSALTQVAPSDRIRQASLHRKTARAWEMQNLYKEALEEYRLAELAFGETSGAPTKQWWHEWIQTRLDRIWLHHMLAQVIEMAGLVDTTRPAVEEHGTQMQQASFFMDVSLLHLRQARYVVTEEVLAFAQKALTASHIAGNMNEVAWIRSHLAFCYTWYGKFEEAEREMTAALDVGKRTGDIRIQSFCLAYLAVLFRKRGNVANARHYSLQALTVAMTTGKPQYMGMANANLAWVAWRERKLVEAEEHGQQALKLWRSVPIAAPFSPFEWIAICPLLGVALAQEHISGAIDYARMLLVPEQEHLPNELTELLEAAIQAGDAEQPGAAQSLLKQAALLGQKSGYF